jgi:putative FmdB family regulatory protein
MPLYEYQCTKCGERTEILQGVSGPPHTHCPKCGGEVKKLFSAPAIQFKGSGFYKTDYASKSSSPSDSKSDDGKSDAKSDTKSDGKGETKSETKTESKTESKAETSAPKSSE